MSIVPLVFRDWWEDFDRPVSRIWDQHFGRGLRRDDLISGFSDLGISRPFPPSSLRTYLGNSNNSYYRPWRTMTQSSGGSSTLKMDKDNYQVRTNNYLKHACLFSFFFFFIIFLRSFLTSYTA